MVDVRRWASTILRVLFLLCAICAPVDSSCPVSCVCRAEESRLKCTGGDGDMASFRLTPVAGSLLELDLSGNSLGSAALPEGWTTLQRLVRLDLSRNRIADLSPGAFERAPSLQRLDLSQNDLKSLRSDQFLGLVRLERLLLDRNRIVDVAADAFVHLVALRQLNISSNPLHCDCDLSRAVRSVTIDDVKLLGAPKCNTPDSLKGQNLKKMKSSDPSRCETTPTPEPDTLRLTPPNGQLVFEGDSLTLRCRMSFQSEHDVRNLTWSFPTPTPDISRVKVFDIYNISEGESVLSISKVSDGDAGNYSCTYQRPKVGQLVERIEIVVVSGSTKYCPTTVTNDKKGLYSWPGTIGGNLISQACREREGAFAHYNCDTDGNWTQLNTSACPYMSEKTKMLEQFALLDLSTMKSSVMGACQRLHSLLLQNSPPKGTLDEPEEVKFIVQTIDNYIKYAPVEKGLGSVLLDIINTMMSLPRAILKAAEETYESCSALVSTVEELSNFALNLQGHKKNLAIEQFSIKRESFTGMTCVWYTMPDLSNRLESEIRRFHCSTTNRTITPLLAERDKIIEASVQIPATLLYRMDHNLFSGVGNVHRAYNMIVVMYDKASFFTRLPAFEDINHTYIDERTSGYYGYRREKRHMELAITSPVVGIKLVNISLVHPLAEPVYIMIRDSGITSSIGGKAVLWDETKRIWTDSPDGCSILRVIANMVVIQCYKLGYVGLMETVETGIYGGRSGGARFKFSHPAIYVGSTILSVCLLFSLLTYTICYSAIHMPVKTKHSLINIWLAMMVLCFMYTFGIFQTEDVQLCQVIGMLIHYLTLSCLLWITVLVSHLYKILSKNHTPSLHSPEDELPSDAPVRKPILGIYLVGWGISLIICGISGAVNMKDYASYSHCFLNSAPALSAVFVPSGIITIFTSILFLLIRCTIRNINGQLSEGTQATENVDLEMWEPSLLVNNTVDRQSEHSTVDSEVEDTEHTPIVQLRAHVIVLCVYFIVWCCGCAAVYNPLSWQFEYQEDTFSILYAVFAAVLGLFFLFFYGFARSDVRAQWSLMSCYLKKRKKCCRNRSVFDKNAQNVSTNHQPLAPISNAAAAAAAAVHARSRSSSQNSNRTNSKSNNSNILKAAAELNSHTYCGTVPNPNKVTNMNLVVLHRQHYRSNNSVITFSDNALNTADIFYNANQSNVARKFFKKQRKNVRKNCLDLPRRSNFDTDSQMSSVNTPVVENIDGVSSILTSSSKVNNTNIHVDRDQLSDTGVKESRNTSNPNILLDNDRSENPTLKRYVIERESAKVLNKKDKEPKYQNSNPILMNIYTNIPETKVPQHQIISSIKLKSNSEGLDEMNVLKETPVSKESMENLPTMRTVSQQCSLEYSSTSEVATPLNQLGSDKTLNTHSELTSLQGTHSALCSMHEITSDTDDAPSFDKYIDFNEPKRNLQNSKKHTSCSKLENESGNSTLGKNSNHSLQNLNLRTKSEHPSGANNPTDMKSDNEDLNTTPRAIECRAKSCSSINKANAVETHFENDSDIYYPNYQMSEVSIHSHGLYAPPPTSLCVNDIGLIFGNSELLHNQTEDDCYENQYENYNAPWMKGNDSELRFHSPAVSCPDVAFVDDTSMALVSEIDELYKQITIKDRRQKKRSRSRSGGKPNIRHCESDSCISESHSDILDVNEKSETRI